MVALFVSIAGFVVYRYKKNQRRYLTTLTRTIYDTIQKSSVVSPYLQINPSIAQGLDRSSVSDSHHVAYVYK
jgi:hypothetical protein